MTNTIFFNLQSGSSSFSSSCSISVSSQQQGQEGEGSKAVFVENPDAETSEKDIIVRHRSPIIPDDFRCPISFELMKDPVFVSSGETFELDAGNRTCPKTHQTLVHSALTPNCVLKRLISKWCTSNGVELPKKQGASDCDRAAIDALLQKLSNGNAEELRAAAGELRLLSRYNQDNKICIAEAGAIPLLVKLLSSSDPRTQENAVTALLNLSINKTNKRSIVIAGAIPGIVDVLKKGSSMEARENAAVTLFSLSVIDENKVAIGAAGAIPALVDLLCNGSPRGKKYAAIAIFNLSIYQENKVRAVRAGIVVPLMGLLIDAAGGMVESLAILANLATHQEGRVAIGQAEPVPVLVEVMRTGSPRNRENAASVLSSLCSGDSQHLENAKESGVEEALKELSENGTDRAKWKAANILELLNQN